MTRKRVVVTGRVQGVFFRDTARRRAEAAGVRGWVTNRSDGAVEAVFEGEPEAVDELVEFCRRGPSRAEVASIEIIEEEPEGLRGFDVR
ncbi:MAG TPA: acylphosphatase [Solirubrobacterales bacterium]|nr:acylphosphatase [Solirubrobacterales bacterium]